MQPAQPVSLVTIEDDDDWSVSFVLGRDTPQRITLERAPRLEFLLPPAQRGVTVRCTPTPSAAHPLVAVQWGAQQVDIVSTTQRFRLDITRLVPSARQAALHMLGKMNFDRSFHWGDGTSA